MQIRPLIITGVMALSLLVSACSSAGNQNNNTSMVATGQAMATSNAVAGGGAAASGTGVVPNTGQTAAPTGGAAGSATGAATAGAGMATGAPAMTSAAPASSATGSATGAATAAATTAATAGATTASGAATQPSTTGTPSAGQVTVPTSIVGIPKTGSNGFIGLGAMFDFHVVDTDGKDLGAVQDFVVNTCESNVAYIVINPASGVGGNSGQQVLVPYQATLATPNSGKADVANHQFVINVKAADLASVPTVDFHSLDMQNPGWEANVMSFWKSHLRLSLTAGCNIPAKNGSTTVSGGAIVTVQPSGTGTPVASSAQATTAATQSGQSTGSATGAGTPFPTRNPNRQTIYRIALASKILSANLRDGNGAPLGTVQDAAVIPDTGHIQYLVVQPFASGQSTNRLVALPMGAVNIQYPDNTGQPAFVFLLNTSVFQQAPAYNPESNAVDQSWFNYWQKFIPMTLQQLP